jgi:hypothetical protein
MRRAAALLALACVSALGCDTETATSAVVDNASSSVTVYKAWWGATLFRDPVAPSAESETERTVPSNDFAYALLAPGWDPNSGAPPSRLVAVRSSAPLSATRGDTLHIVVSDDAFVGDCAAGKPLSQDDADFITQRIFPGDFAGGVYDATTCTTHAAADAASE